MFFRKRILEIGPTTLIDLDQISAVYREGSLLVIRIGGMGVIRLDHTQLNDSIGDTYKKIRKGLGL